MQWFNVDKQGLAKLLARKGIEFVIYELVQNTWDEDTTNVTVSLERIRGTKYAHLRVEDDNPEGFRDLSHSFTLFADSTKKNDAEKRGRFNLGEKLVLAVCEDAEISSTKGTVVFNESGRHQTRMKRDRGSVFEGTLRLTNEQIEECNRAVLRLIPPAGIKTTYNGTELVPRPVLKTVTATLPTEIADPEGYLRKTSRKTEIEILEPLDGEVGTIYEMGIPVVETGDRFHVNIRQKVPLTVDRDNVTPAYLSLVRSFVVEATASQLTTEDANATWVKDAIEEHGEELDAKTIDQVVTLRFGEKRVAYDPSDAEANKLAVTQGYTVVYGNQLSKAEWGAIRRTSAILPAGQVTPSPKPFHPDGEPLKVLPESKWTPEIINAVNYISRVSEKLIGKSVSIQIASDIGWPFSATYGGQRLIFNLGRLGHAWFADRSKINRLLIHELGHEYSMDHLSSDYHDALCRLGAKLTDLALDNPDLLRL